jgi:hypothetical protein
MLDVRYQKLIPYPFEVVLGQYYDYEHIRFVHPETLGEYRLVERDGSSVVYEQVWPRRLGRRPRSLVRQTGWRRTSSSSGSSPAATRASASTPSSASTPEARWSTRRTP